jgi:hypothetical protein
MKLSLSRRKACECPITDVQPLFSILRGWNKMEMADVDAAKLESSS